MSPLVVHIAGLKLPTGLNQRGHYLKIAKRVEAEHAAVGWHLNAAHPLPPPLPVVVTIVRWGKNKVDSDNVAGAEKGVRDAVARYLRLPPGPGGRPDDSDPRVRWVEWGGLGPPGVTIAIEPWHGFDPLDDGLERLEVVTERRKGALAKAFPDSPIWIFLLQIP